MNIALIGGGGREDALCRKLSLRILIKFLYTGQRRHCQNSFKFGR